MKQKKHSAGVKAVREMLSLGVKEARKQTGLPTPLLNRLKEGKVERISHKTFNKFRNAHARIIYHTLVDHNVPRKEATSRKYGLTFNTVREAVKMTQYGKPLDTALNELEQFIDDMQKPPEKRIVYHDAKQFTRKKTAEEKEYRRLARRICHNNNFYQHWVDEGKTFFNSKRPVRTRKDCVELMLQIMAYGDRNLKGWDLYVSEERAADKWVPMKSQKIKGTRKYARVPVPASDPKYVDWQRRTAQGKIIYD